MDNKNVSKVDQIIGVAQKLFGMYGLDKVSMLEIANSLHISKASLYYYFPDKMSIYKAVLEKEHAEFISRITDMVNGIKTPGKKLSEYAVMRLEYFRRLLNLSRIRLEAYSDMKPVFRETNQIFREKEMVIVKGILESGVDNDIFRIDDITETASLFLDLLKGLRTSIITDHRTLMLDNAAFESILDRTRSFIRIFINGLKYRQAYNKL